MSAAASGEPAPADALVSGGRIQPWHRERLAMVYVRQSTPQQVADHQESTRLQYGLRARAQAWGWPPQRVVVIDDDLGKTGTSAAERAGFQRLVSEVGMGHVGLILGVEMSRLARSNKDWHQLLELCALFGTLLADGDGVYDPGQYNDRLLLGLKGTMSEAELHIMQQRMRQGLLNKARRGALQTALPAGYVRRPTGEVMFDPDEQAQDAVRLIFRKFEELGTLNAVLRYLVRHDILVGIREGSGPAKGELAWHRPNRVMLQTLLKHPIYAGAFVYGRRQVNPRRKRAGRPNSGRVVVAAERWHVLIRDQVPAYISWAQFEQHQARLAANRARADSVGAPRDGTAVLSGLLVCGACGARMTVRYGGATSRLTYVCGRQMTDYGGAPCQAMAGDCLDAYVSRAVLAALEPASLELSLEAAEHVERERAALRALWRQRRERAAFEADRAGRQFRLVEPEHRLVARHLEREWEEKLAAQQRLEEEFRRSEHREPPGLSADEREAIRRLAADIPALWHAPTTTAAERQEVIRQVVRRVVVRADGRSERVRVGIDWVGGARTEGGLARPVGRLEQLSYYPELCRRLRALAEGGRSTAEIAAQLNAEGYRPPRRGATFRAPGVQALLRRLGIRLPQAQFRASRPRAPLGEHEWELGGLARAVGMPPVTLYNWVRRGWVRARQEPAPPRRWVLWADPQEQERLRSRSQRPAGFYTRRRWVEDDDVAARS